MAPSKKTIKRQLERERKSARDLEQNPPFKAPPQTPHVVPKPPAPPPRQSASAPSCVPGPATPPGTAVPAPVTPPHALLSPEHLERLRMVESIVIGCLQGAAAWQGFSAASGRDGLVPTQCTKAELESFLNGYTACVQVQQLASAVPGASVVRRPPAPTPVLPVRPPPPWRLPARTVSPGPPPAAPRDEIQISSRAHTRPGSAQHTVSCLELSDPKAGGLTMHCGRYHLIQQRVQLHPHFKHIVHLAHESICTFGAVEFTCRRGRHRSVAMAEIVAELLRRRGGSRLACVTHVEAPRCRVPECTCSCGVPGDFDKAIILSQTQVMWDNF